MKRHCPAPLSRLRHSSFMHCSAKPSPIRAILLHDSTLSSQNQCEALADALLIPKEQRVLKHVPQSRFFTGTPFLGYPSASNVLPLNQFELQPNTVHRDVPTNITQLDKECDRNAFTSRTCASNDATVKSPNLVIGCGRRTAPLVAGLRWYFQHSRQNVPETYRPISVQIHHPRCGSYLNQRCFDLIVTPLHDMNGDDHSLRPYEFRDKYSNIFPTIGSISSQQFSRMGNKNSGTLVVLVGGPNSWMKQTHFRSHALSALAVALNSRKHFERVEIIGSRRTPSDVIKEMKLRCDEEVADKRDSIQFWMPGCPTPNPYHSALRNASCILVTADSVAMISDACSCSVPVYIPSTVSLEYKNNKFSRFINQLEQSGRITVVHTADDIGVPLMNPLLPSSASETSFVPLNDALRTAEIIQLKFKIG